ncbi:DegT/DnrJ/EryC1/StrS family aminotransferase [Streptomyces sp. NPDC091377]|uniref:DegT/DnrJ/EryC1/StrS family aminotransferase n=1 Tax=Streptomyces sp. NPDC091377 TaxID=3365995 RepID=UPI003807830E
MNRPGAHPPPGGEAVGAATLAEDAEDLRYLPPPARPAIDLHPSRTGPRTVASVLLRRSLHSATRTRLEARLSAQSGRPRCVLTRSGRSALVLALSSLGAVHGREVVLSTLNCPAVADAVLAAGATPVLVDTDERDGPHYGSVDVRGRVVVLTNVLGLDEHSHHAWSIAERGGIPVLDLAQALPSAAVLARYRASGWPLVLSFGEGKALGALGGGALLDSGTGPGRDTGPWSQGHGPVGARSRGATALGRGLGQWCLSRSPAPVRAGAVRRQRRSPGWSLTRADHLPLAPGPVPRGAPDPWETAATATLLERADVWATGAAEVRRRVSEALGPALLTCRVVPSEPGLSGGIDLLFRAPGLRYPFARTLARHGVPSTWNPYPLHRTRPYARYANGPLPSADLLWRRVLTVPALPQPRLDAPLLTSALLAADRETAHRGGRDG